MSKESPERKMIKRRVKNVGHAVQLLTKLILKADERIDSFKLNLDNLTAKLEALADAQMKTQAAMARIPFSNRKKCE